MMLGGGVCAVGAEGRRSCRRLRWLGTWRLGWLWGEGCRCRRRVVGACRDGGNVGEGVSVGVGVGSVVAASYVDRPSVRRSHVAAVVATTRVMDSRLFPFDYAEVRPMKCPPKGSYRNTSAAPRTPDLGG